jgi:hypothetical protein
MCVRVLGVLMMLVAANCAMFSAYSGDMFLGDRSVSNVDAANVWGGDPCIGQYELYEDSACAETLASSCTNGTPCEAKHCSITCSAQDQFLFNQDNGLFVGTERNVPCTPATPHPCRYNIVSLESCYCDVFSTTTHPCGDKQVLDDCI